MKNKKILFSIIGSFFFIGIALRIFKLGDYNFRNDEFQVINTAYNYLINGTFNQWNFWSETMEGLYNRAWIHSLLVATSFKLFGVNEFTARLPSFVFGLIMLLVGFLFTKYFTKNTKLALLVLFALALNPWLIKFSRYTRMYAILGPLFLISAYFFYRSINSKNFIDFKLKIINNLVEKWADFNFIWVSLALITTFIAYLVHKNALMIIPSVYIYLIYKLIKTKNTKYIIPITIPTILAFIYFFTDIYIFPNFMANLTLFEMQNFNYISIITAYPFLNIISGLLLLSSFYMLFKIKDKEIKDRFIFLWCITLFCLVFFIFIGNRYAYPPYISFLFPITIILTVWSYNVIFASNNKKVLNILFILIFLITIVGNLGFNLDNIYVTNSYGKFSESYNVIENHYKDGQIIFAQYPQYYYFQNLQKNATFVNLLNNQEYSLETFITEASEYDSGWLVWSTRKKLHVDIELRRYVCDNFQHIHGETCGNNLDKNRVEVFYYTKDMIQ